MPIRGTRRNRSVTSSSVQFGGQPVLLATVFVLAAPPPVFFLSLIENRRLRVERTPDRP
jgi:hypothetical protein